MDHKHRTIRKIYKQNKPRKSKRTNKTRMNQTIGLMLAAIPTAAAIGFAYNIAGEMGKSVYRKYIKKKWEKLLDKITNPQKHVKKTLAYKIGRKALKNTREVLDIQYWVSHLLPRAMHPLGL